MITKKQAQLLAAYEFRLVDKQGKEFEIKSSHKDCYTIDEAIHIKAIQYAVIGVDYFILCRPYSQLTDEIEHGGERFEPIKKISYRGIATTYYAADKYVVANYRNGVNVMNNWEEDLLLTWNFKPQWLDEKFVKYINQ